MVDQIKQHFRAYESPFIDFAEGLLRQVHDEYRPILTDFLNPRQRYIVETLINGDDEVKVVFWGGYDDAENQRGLFIPSYYEWQISDFDLRVLQINYPVKFAELHHSDILGALVNAGLQRNRIGDIIVDEQQNWQVIVTDPIAQYIQQSPDLTRIGRVKVHYLNVENDNVLEPLQDYLLEETLVTSLRLDIIVANGYNISRSKAKELIEHGLVKINWTVMERPDEVVAINDLISVRRYGRLKITALNGQTKKDKWRISLNIIKK
ncbi:RNA-binding protein [Weissella coleopterorum]|uniref:RNA-binding protein n=1 Tax=Weissella coleopterorum TaxID=2714949 RepID=A0A6G8B007_9LACO|nr:YlmH/Sll1252 family protein [Weissella coleopterorum]QIL50545.1 RNA-binding protein [Weissella coleopterorum]